VYGFPIREKQLCAARGEEIYCFAIRSRAENALCAFFFTRTAANFEKKKIFLEILQVFSVLRRIISEEQKTGY